MYVFFFQAEDGIRDLTVTGVQTCALPISSGKSIEFKVKPGKYQATWNTCPSGDKPYYAGTLIGEAAIGVDQQTQLFTRSEERRVGKECRSRWSPYHKKKKIQESTMQTVIL